MSGGLIQLKRGQVLFNEGDAADAMYVIKSGRIAITKKKGSGEIVLAELKPGEMLGEMGFFDNKPRSAGAKASSDSNVIALPFSALHAQFKTFPEWLKAMVKTVNSHLRNANQRIKNLEAAQADDADFFMPHMITGLTAVISLVGYKAGIKEEDGLVVSQYTLRNYCIQIFKLPTNKMDRMMETLQSLGIMKVEDLGEGKKRICIIKHELLGSFVDWYNEYLFKPDEKKITVEEKELGALKCLAHYGRMQTPDDKGEVTVSLTEISQTSVQQCGVPFTTSDTDALARKGIVQEKVTQDAGVLVQSFNLKDVDKLAPFWEIVYTLQKVR